MNIFKLFVTFLLGLIALNVIAQTDKATTKKIVDAKSYVFVATSAIPLNTIDISNVMSKMNGNINGGTINLTGNNYDLKIMPDSIISFLPYYGRSFTAPIGSVDSGIKFTSIDFTYEAVKTKKNWQVTIFIKDNKDSPKLNLYIGEGGYASLSVITNNKQSITYNGYISAHKEDK